MFLILMANMSVAQSKEAQFVGGTNALNQWLKENVLPLVENADELSFTRVHLRFQISEEGNVTAVKILRESQELRIESEE